MANTTQHLEAKIEAITKWLEANRHLKGTQYYRLKAHSKHYYINQLATYEAL